jgi:cytidyltransferase-like protein
MKETLERIIKILNDSNLKWWLDYGQLLSLHRSGEPLKWKDDWDFCIVKQDEKSFDTILKKVKKITGIVFERKRKYIRFVISDLSFDFYFCQEDFENKSIKQENFQDGGFDMPIFFYDRLDTINFDSIQLNVPRHLDYYLTIRYGDEWITPIKKDMSRVVVQVGQQYKKENYTCLVAGVFDGLHEGHQNLIEHAIKYFDKVKIGVHSNKVIDYKEPPKYSMSERINMIILKYPDVEIIEDCPLITDIDYLKSNNCDYVVFGDENSENMNKFYPSKEVNHPIDRYPVLSSRLINKQTINSFCINIIDKKERYVEVLKEMVKINVYPKRFVVDKHKLEKRIKREGVTEKSNQILESHLRLYKKLSQTDGDIFLVLEDDAIVIDNINLEDIISKAPKDWDVIYLGGVNHHNEHPPIMIDEIFYKAKFTFNAHALLIKKSFIPDIITELEKRENESDVIFAYMQSKGIGNWYGLIEDAIIQHGKYNTSFIRTLSESCFDKVSKLNGDFNIKMVDNIKFKNFNKIFQIGFNKCGTTSIHQFFLNNNIESIHWEGGKIANEIIKNQSTDNPLGSYSKYKVFTDFENPYNNYYPNLTHYKLLNEKYPDSIFILNVRDIDDWIQSRINHRIGNGEMYIDLFKKVNNIKTNEEVIEVWRNQWKQHINSVNDYFKEYDKFIHFDINNPIDFIKFISKHISLISNKFPNLN